MGQSKDDQRRIIPVEKITELGKETTGIAELIPDINFCGFSAYIFLLSSICKELGHNLPQDSFAADCWSYIDGGCSVIIGVGQIASPKHEPIANRARGSSNIISGGQLIWLTMIGLGPIGFAAGVGNVFVQSLYNTAKTFRRMYDVEFWYEDTQNELKYIQQEQRNIDAEIAQLRKDLDPNSANRMTNWLIKKKEYRKDDLIQKEALLNSHIKSHDDSISNNTCFKPSLQKELAENLYDNLMFGSAFVGMVLMCIPGAQLAAILLVGISVSLFLYKHRPRYGKEFSDFQSLVDSKAEVSYKLNPDSKSDDQEGEGTIFDDEDDDSGRLAL